MILQSLIGGRWADGTLPEERVENPANPKESVATFRPVDRSQVDDAVASAEASRAEWRGTAAHDRARILAGAAIALDERAEPLGRELTEEEGKPLREAVGEVRRSAEILRFYAAEADRDVGSLYSSPRQGEHILVRHVPVGPVALITPWNFPLAIPTWKLAPALLFGNPVIWKPSPVAPRMAIRLTEVLLDAGLPEGVLSVVLGGTEVAQHLLCHPKLRGCSFTGSTPAGLAVAAAAAQRGIKVQTEMGGANAAVVLADADLELAAAAIVSGAMASSGQKCTATSRAIVVSDVYDTVLDLVVDRCRSLVVGDPMHEATDLGPLATRPQLADVARVLSRSKATGASVVLDGEIAADPDDGYYAGPSVVTGRDGTDPLVGEEVFGPVLSFVRADSTHQALEMADATAYGLSAAVFTDDLGAALTAIDRLDVGVLHVNRETTGADPHVPFGGVKQSGFGGREMGRAARDFYTELRTIYLAPPRDSAQEQR